MKRYILTGNVHDTVSSNLPVMVKDTFTGKYHERPQYFAHEAQQVADWLNGMDQPLKTMLAPEKDDRYQRYVRQFRGGPEGSRIIRHYPPTRSGR